MGHDPKVVAPDHIQTGDYANAVRVAPDEEGFVLDFMAYSEKERAAVVVRRVHVSLGFLPLIRDQVSAAIAA